MFKNHISMPVSISDIAKCLKFQVKFVRKYLLDIVKTCCEINEFKNEHKLKNLRQNFDYFKQV